MSVKIFACKNCSAAITFNIEAQKWICNYCSAEFDKDEIKEKTVSDSGVEKKEDLSVKLPDLDEYVCSACGSVLLCEENTAATFCLYCKSPTVIKSRFSGEFKPRYIIPFKLTEKEAQEYYSAWIKKRFFAPRSFKTAKEVDNIRGLYAPYWLFDCKVSGYIEGEGRIVRSWRSGDYRVTETKYYDIKRAGYADYSRIPVDGSEHLEDELMEGVEPFMFSEMKDFALEYMSGFLAEKYDLDESKALPFMQNRAQKFLETTLKTAGDQYSSVSINSKNLSVNAPVAAYSMLPIYILTNFYKNKPHRFILNGQTGKIYGQTPYVVSKMIIFFITVFLATWIVSIFAGGAIYAFL